MKTISEILPGALAQVLEPPTRVEAPCMPGPLRELWQKELLQFQTFREPQLESMVKEATRFLDEIASRGSPRWISFLGPSGTGKTLLAKMMMRFIRGHFLLFSPGYGINLADQAISLKWTMMVREMKEGDFGSTDLLTERETKWDNIMRPTYAYALIDDIGQIEDRMKAYLSSALATIADARMGSWTIWTANLRLNELGEQLDPRLASRMIRGGNVVVENECQDFNLRQTL